MVEVEELLKDNAITLQSGSTTISLKKHGLYRIDADHSVRFRVYDGEAVITSGERTMEAKKGHEVQLDQMLMAKFDTDVTDPFYRWSERRAGYVATANVSSARSVLGGSGYGSGLGYNTNIGYGGLGYGGFGYSNWVYNPWFGMYTFVPLSGFAYSPFGYAIYSPMTVRYVVVQPAVQTSYLGAVAQRTASPPTIRATSADAAPGSGRRGVGVAVGGSSGVGANPGGNGGGNSVANSGGGGGSVASRSSAPAAAPSAAPAAAPAAARSGGSAGARGR
jgi:hypothetical protein